MLIYKIVVHREQVFDADAQAEAFDLLLGSYRLDGHILGGELMTIAREQRFECYAFIPAHDAFDPKLTGEWVHKRLEGLHSVHLSFPELIEIGCDPSEGEGCTCSEPPSLILFTTYLRIQSPVRCGGCFHSVPLYRLPRFKSGEHSEAITWADDYKACDSLFMNSGAGERFGYRQMSMLTSGLSQQGLRICTHYEQGTGKAAYYYLHRYYGRSVKREKERRCPGCGGEWRLATRWHDFFDFRCDKCRLVSCYSSAICQVQDTP
jgi:predicted  nucleic acid-binding Zn ribbon protein